MNYYVYAIYSQSAKRTYIGQTNNIKDRIKRHNTGQVKSTKYDKPWKLIALQEFDSRNQSMWIEKNLKKSKGKRDKWLVENKI